MKSINEDEIPLFLQEQFFKMKIDIMVQGIKDSGMKKEFLDFMESPEINDVSDAEEIFIIFAKKYPDKFYIVPEEERTESFFVEMISKK